jgi:MYXO-CTERM domain-containing protein
MFCSASGLCVTECEKSCVGKECGDDGCGGSCGSCGTGYSCENGLCKTGCKPDCLNRECGPDKCGGSCGSCGLDYLCTVDGLCVSEDEADGYSILDPEAWAGSWDEEDVTEGNGVGYSGYVCPPGQKLWYGKCIPTQPMDGDGAAAAGCGAATPSSSSTATPWLLLSLLAALGLSRRRTRRA